MPSRATDLCLVVNIPLQSKYKKMKKIWLLIFVTSVIQQDVSAQWLSRSETDVLVNGMITTFTSSSPVKTAYFLVPYASIVSGLVSGMNTTCPMVSLSANASTEITLAIKVILAGPYDATLGLMNDSLRVNNMIPFNEPYSASPYIKPVIGCAAGETVCASVLSVTGQDAIVDWIFLELRSPFNVMNIICTKRALLQRDGDVVSEIDGISLVSFPGIQPGNYYVSVKHRTHLGVMTKSAVSFVSGVAAIVDFTSESV